MATSKLNAEQFANVGNFAGIMLVYTTVNKDGKTVSTGQHFFGKDFEAADSSENEIFRVIKSVTGIIWHTTRKERELRESADGIRSKFRAATPSDVIIHDKTGMCIEHDYLAESVWARIGFVPTKLDLERSNRDFDKAIHNAAKAIRDALKFKPNLSTTKPAEKPAVQPVETVAATVTETATETVVETAAATVTETIAEVATAVPTAPAAKGKGKGKGKATEQAIAEQPQEQPTEVTAEVPAEVVAETTAEVPTEQPTEQVIESQPVVEMEVAA